MDPQINSGFTSRQASSWVPDVRARSFVRAARQQSKAVASSKRAKSDQGFINAISDHAAE
jgi:hypothetical protein